jgi:hypothetical protein
MHNGSTLPSSLGQPRLYACLHAGLIMKACPPPQQDVTDPTSAESHSIPTLNAEMET